MSENGMLSTIKEGNADEIWVYNHLCIIGARDTGVL